MTKQEHDYVTVCLMRRIKNGDLEHDFNSLALAISNEIEVPFEKCKEIMYEAKASEIMSVFIKPEGNDQK